MWWKIIRFWGKIPPDLKKLVLWLFQSVAELFIKGRKPDKKEAERIILEFIKQANMPDEHKVFIMTVIKYHYNDGKITLDEIGNLMKLWVGLNGLVFTCVQNNEGVNISIKIQK